MTIFSAPTIIYNALPSPVYFRIPTYIRFSTLSCKNDKNQEEKPIDLQQNR